MKIIESLEEMVAVRAALHAEGKKMSSLPPWALFTKDTLTCVAWEKSKPGKTTA